jgi:hypothetical protein
MERNGDYAEKWCNCVPFVFSKLRDKKYLRFSFDSPWYINMLPWGEILIVSYI